MRVFGVLALINLVLAITTTVVDRRQFRNGVFLMFSLIFAYGCLLLSDYSMIAVVFLLITPFLILLLAILLIINGVIVLKKEKKNLKNALTLLFGLFIIFAALLDMFMIIYLSNTLSITAANIGFTILFAVNALYFYFGFFFLCFFLNNVLYTVLPVKRKCDYIIIHGSGLLGGNQVTPLLKGRCDKAIKLFHQQKDQAIFIPSGGQGEDETVSEAYAITEYLLSQGIPKDHILLENQSSNTLENLLNCRQLIEAQHPDKKYRAIFVTNDYHLFRTGLYAKKARLKAAGVGCSTASYYWPVAMFREYIAVLVMFKKPFIIYCGLVVIASLVLLFA